MLTIVRTVAPTVSVVTLAELKAHLRVDFSDDDALITGLGLAATEYAEHYTSRAFIQQTWRLSMDAFPYYGDAINHRQNVSTLGFYNGLWSRSLTINLPRPRLMAVSSVTYVDANGATQTIDPSLYTVDADSEPARIVPVAGSYWPYPKLYRPNTVQVTFTAGYGTDATNVPMQAKLAIKMLAAHWYEHREAATDGQAITNIPLGVNALLDAISHRVFTYRNS